MTIGLSFSDRSKLYASVRPAYPELIFSTLSKISPATDLCWDVGCGSGQASVGAAKYFKKVLATDLSEEQIAHAQAAPNIDYCVAGTDAPFIAYQSVDLIISACAAHWFERSQFYREAERVLKPAGVLALWSYFHPEVNSNVDTHVRRYYRELCGPLVPTAHNQYMDLYASLDFPDWEKIEAPVSEIKVSWGVGQLLGFMGTYSTRRKYQEINQGIDPLELVSKDILAAWGDTDTLKEVALPLGFRIGRKST
jgi:SAM-dependent methyltransferase